jgi:hypothetical protein
MTAENSMPEPEPGNLASPSLEEAVHSDSSDVLKSAAADPALSEDLALALLKNSDLTPEVLEQLGKNSSVMKYRKVKLALVENPRTPRYISLPMVRSLFTFDLMRVALMPVAPSDVKIVADEALINRLKTISSGERLSLARRASGRIAGELLLDPEPRVIRIALENYRLLEASVLKTISRQDAPAAFIEAVCHHSKWSVRREIRMALLRNEKTPLARALEYSRTLPPPLVREILHVSRLPASVKSYLEKDLKERLGQRRKASQ